MELTKEQIKTLKAVAKFASSDKDGLSALTHVRVETIDGNTTFVATNRYAIAFFTLKNVAPADRYERFLVPAKALASLPLKDTKFTYCDSDALLIVGNVMYSIDAGTNYPHVDQFKPSGEPIADNPRVRTDLLKLLGNFPDTLDISIKDHNGTSVLCAERHTGDYSLSTLIMSTRRVD